MRMSRSAVGAAAAAVSVAAFAAVAPSASAFNFGVAGPRAGGRSTLPSVQRAPSAAVSTSTALFSGPPPKRGGYVRQGEEITVKKRDPPYPKIGDVVRFFDVDGGKADGEVLVGKIVLIQPILQKEGAASVEDDGTNKWLVEIAELEDVGDGYYAEYPSRKRGSKRSLRKLEEVCPVSASFVRTEDAYRVPRDKNGRPASVYEGYKLIGYEGPAAVPINEEVVKTDMERYNELKFKLIKDAALAGLFVTVLVDLFKGLDDALTYFAGAIGGVGYLFFLSVKTDTVGSPGAKLGNNVSNLRFVLPALVLLGVAGRNLALGSLPGNAGLFSTVSTEQFACAMLGFLTYRIPLFLGQLSPVVGDSLTDMLPGSAGVAMQMARDAKNAGEEESNSLVDENLTPVLLVCGPPGTGKTSLVQRLVSDDNRFVEPAWMDRVRDPATFERLELRDEFLRRDSSGRYGLTKEGILNAAETAATEAIRGSPTDANGNEAALPPRAVVIDGNVDLARKLTALSGARLIGVWVGLDTMEKFETRIRSQIESGDVQIPPDGDADSVVRAKVKEIVQDIEYGVVSGVFEFTVLNDDFEDSVRQLKAAAEYCFK